MYWKGTLEHLTSLFIAEEAEAQRGYVICPKSHTQQAPRVKITVQVSELLATVFSCSKYHRTIHLYTNYESLSDRARDTSKNSPDGNKYQVTWHLSYIEVANNKRTMSMDRGYNPKASV